MDGMGFSDLGMSRRSFCALSATAAATLCAADALYGMDSRLVKTAVAAEAEAPAEWKTLACLHGCGQRCMNQALVKDGVVIRQKTDDTHPDSIEHPQQRGCLRGRTLVEHENGADRIKYPMKRISWSPDDPHGELRGKEGYERIGWDEALDLVAAQLKKAYQEHGPRSVYAPVNLENGRKGYEAMLNALGGYLTVSDSISYGTYLGNTEDLGLSYGGECMANDRLDMIKNADVVVLHGQNPGWSANGNPATFFRAARDNGAQMVCIGPSKNVSSAMLDARWIPVLPGTDTALMIGTAGEMVKLEEEKGGILDWDFLHRCCVGFDKDSMPEGADAGKSYLAYLKGETDGQVKDAAWATERCGTPEEDIRWLAETLRKDNNVVLSHGYAAARANGAEDLPQAYMALACMGGHIGKPGNALGNHYVDRQGPVGEQLVSTGGDGTDEVELPKLEPLYDPAKVEGTYENDYVNGLQIWDAVINGEYDSTGRCWSGVFDAAVPRKADIRVIFGCRDGSGRSVPDTAKMAEAMRKVDFVCMEHHVATPTLQYADIILPTLANIEQDQIAGNADRDREMVLVYSKLSDTPYEARSDQQIAEAILERLGYNPRDVYPFDEKQRYFNKLAGTQVLDEDGEYRPLCTITPEDIARWGVEGAPQEGRIGLEDLRKKGIYQVERRFGDAYTTISYEDFVRDPKANPLTSESGKFELSCQKKADTLNTIAFAGETYEPYPTWHEQERSDDYPLTMFTTHHPRSACSDFNNVATLRETFTVPVTMNRADAEARGIKDGDPVLVSSPHGKIARPVSVSSLVMPGAVDVPNGTWPRFDENGVDHGGCPNTLYGGKPKGMGVSGYNNVGVQVEKWTGAALTPDKDTQLTIDPEAAEEA